MNNKPSLTSYTVNVHQTPVTVSGIDHGPVAHFLAVVDSSEEFDLREFCDAFANLFLAKIKKPCLVETPSDNILIWREGSKMCFSCYRHQDTDIEPGLLPGEDDSDTAGGAGLAP